MKNNGNSKSTKDQILDAAFSFCNTPRMKEFSLSEVAEVVGISKTAIYRHFKNKDDLYKAMEDSFFDTMADHLKVIEPENIRASKVPFSHLIDYFIQNTQYINFFIRKFSSEEKYERKAFEEIKKRFDTAGINTFGISDYKDIEENRINNPEMYVRQIFCGITIFYFIKMQQKMFKCKKIKKVPANASEKLVDLMLDGLNGTMAEGEFFHLEGINESRLQELNRICQIGNDVLPEENRFFIALANVIKKYTMTGVTVERIASELNMAKSSLYEYFDNKNQLILSIIEKEMNLLLTITRENSAEAANFTEYAYVVMRTEMEFFKKRLSIIPICGWLLMKSEDALDHPHEHFGDKWVNTVPREIIMSGTNLKIPSMVLLGWMWCLPVGLLAHCTKSGISAEEIDDFFEIIWKFVVNGIDGK